MKKSEAPVEGGPGKRSNVVIIGAGPAGLTAASEILERTDLRPIVLEKSGYLGGISRTVDYKGNKIDIGGHRFFTKSDRVLDWWLDVLPVAGSDPPTGDLSVMLERERKSRIYFADNLFDYPISLDPGTLRKLGLARALRIAASYLWRVVFPIRDERNLEDFFTNRFGRQLYLLFFKSYTEKVWGIPCSEIGAEWGGQRVKGLSIGRALLHFAKSIFRRNKGIEQKQVETSLIERFLYPPYGPGQMWQEVGRRVTERGGEIRLGCEVDRLRFEGDRVVAVETRNVETGERVAFDAEHVFSTMPVKDLVRAMDTKVPEEAGRIAEGLMYRDFITVGLLLERLSVSDRGKGRDGLASDNWIYIQEPGVQVGRLQIFNNWSPYLVADPSKVWVGLEYFCFDTDDIWNMPEEEMARLGTDELEKIGFIEERDVLDRTVIRMEKAYPVYSGTYGDFEKLRLFLDGIENLFLIGRNGMHRYNNQDHSMLTAMVAVDNICKGLVDRSNIWQVNAEDEYHETK